MDSIAAVVKNNIFNPAPTKGIQKGPGASIFPGNFDPLNLNMAAPMFTTKKAIMSLQTLILITWQLLCHCIDNTRITDIKPITAPISIMITRHFIPIALTATDNGVALLRIVKILIKSPTIYSDGIKVVIVDINDKERFQHTLPKRNSLQEEDHLNLDEVLQIIDNQNVLYIKRTSKMDWSNLIDMCEYGYIIESDNIKRASNKSFEIKRDNLNYRLLNSVNNESKIHESTVHSKMFKKVEPTISKSCINLTKNFIKEITDILDNDVGDKALQLRDYQKNMPIFMHDVSILVALFYQKIQASFINFSYGATSEIKRIYDDTNENESIRLIGGKFTDNPKIWVNSLDDFTTWELVETDDNYPLFDYWMINCKIEF
ncbi:hypothetical protein F8M41_015997 [Gigaspora margarita]|uniref:Uncharacterized protein n=1 Tax=Gigaspora margarita TaxID=4874 RepID=A0A8H4B376_GIGMA|nr:hypothetical protein F8M41_015997 [Gigaspora margarita]